ncbi:MAG: alpha/beta hydrolase, partial [Chitinophagales bacterium]|nr:alpha/beta hydrolase [Chitinophagales bacterium]
MAQKYGYSMYSCNFKRFVNEANKIMKVIEKAVELILRIGGKDSFVDIKSTRTKMNNAAKWLMPKLNNIAVEYDAVQGIPVAWMKPVGAVHKVLFYLHGGAYVVGSIETHKNLAGTIAGQANINALVVDYRLAPEHPYPAALEDAVYVYKHLLENGYHPDNIAIGGDSAGGGLTMSVLLYLRDNELQLPNCAVLLCPWLDLTNSSSTYQTNKDVMLKKEDLDSAVQMYTAGKEDIRHPYVSPLYGQLRGLPPI